MDARVGTDWTNVVLSVLMRSIAIWWQYGLVWLNLASLPVTESRFPFIFPFYNSVASLYYCMELELAGAT